MKTYSALVGLGVCSMLEVFDKNVGGSVVESCKLNIIFPEQAGRYVPLPLMIYGSVRICVASNKSEYFKALYSEAWVEISETIRRGPVERFTVYTPTTGLYRHRRSRYHLWGFERYCFPKTTPESSSFDADPVEIYCNIPWRKLP